MGPVTLGTWRPPMMPVSRGIKGGVPSLPPPGGPATGGTLLNELPPPSVGPVPGGRGVTGSIGATGPGATGPGPEVGGMPVTGGSVLSGSTETLSRSTFTSRSGTIGTGPVTGGGVASGPLPRVKPKSPVGPLRGPDGV
ncbi:hypothetical protein C0216_26725 [Streptomyces globosus]|uniref:Uncharacterized protein n=1 Tax=Streptomyces globosus TaxID=68209 RepID=A0A344U6N4_9ACTN|nr:hypothetical protein C0216_26725 [Streptomyces globosus]